MSNIDGNDDDEGTSVHAGDNDSNDNDDDVFVNVLDNDDDEDDNEEDYSYDNVQPNMDVDYNVEVGGSASSKELKQRCIKMTEAFFAHYPPKVMKAAMDYIDSIGDNGIVIWMQALCAFFDMSIESGRESSIPEDFNTNKSPSVKFTLKVLDPIAKLLNAVTFRCNMRRDCERKGDNCLDARASEASKIAPLIACIAKYAHSRGNTFYVVIVGGRSIAKHLPSKVRQLTNGEVSFVNEDGNHFKFFQQFNAFWFPSSEVQKFVMTKQLVGMASELGVARDIVMKLASSLAFISSDYLDLDAPKRKRFEDAYNAHRQKAIQKLAQGRIDKALISKFDKTRDQCSPVEIENANALITVKANRKRKRTDDINKTQQKDFFSRVDELEAYKEKHGHLNVQCNEDESLFGFCCRLRSSRRAIASGKGTASYKLTDDRIAALDAIGFDWQLNKTQQMICEVNMFDCDLTFIIPQQYVFTNNQLSLTHRG
jgi:hypothetical protein